MYRWQPCDGLEGGGGEISNRRISLMGRRGCPRRRGADANTDEHQSLLGSPCICREPSPTLWTAMDEPSVFQPALSLPSLLCTHRLITTCCAGCLFSSLSPLRVCLTAHEHTLTRQFQGCVRAGVSPYSVPPPPSLPCPPLSFFSAGVLLFPEGGGGYQSARV